MKTTKLRTPTIALLCVLALAGAARVHALPILTLSPGNGAITGAAGSTVGWGFTVTNPDANYAVLTSSDFCVGMACSTTLGVYTDFIAPQFLIVGPTPESTSVTQSFNNNVHIGVGSFHINPAATGSALGEIKLTYDLFSVDPNAANFDPLTDTVSVGNLLAAAASVTVVSQTVTTPEPATWLLMLGGMASAFALRRRS